MNAYKVLRTQKFVKKDFSIVPIRRKDRYTIMRWRNEQIYHLRQNKPLTKEEQDRYFENVVSKLFDQDEPDQILFSYLQGEKCIGYGGLVHINWTDKNAEISFLMNTSLEKKLFDYYWTVFLELIEKAAKEELGLHKIYTYAYDLRPFLYNVLEKNGFYHEATLKDHCLIQEKLKDVVIHSKRFTDLYLRRTMTSDIDTTYKWASDKSIRLFAFNKSKITKTEHQKWFEEKTKDNNCEFFILMDNGNCIGSIRFDITIENSAIISYLIDPAKHGKGYGKLILKMGLNHLIQKRKDVKTLLGFVHKHNLASIKIFNSLRFQMRESKKDEITFMFNL